MKIELKDLQGLGKLSKTYLYRLISRTVIGINGERCNGASSCELLAVIYLSQIADSHGNISQFKISDFSLALQCSEREAYVLLHGLTSKGYISSTDFNNKKWTGFRNITLVNNTMPQNKYDKNTRYLNTFHNIFDFSNPCTVSCLKKLSLYALRLLLFLLFSYNYTNGYNTSADYLCELLSIQERQLINVYLKELEPLFGDFYRINPSRRRSYGFIHIYSKNNLFIPEKRPSDTQLSYYKRKWFLYFINHHCSIDCDLTVLLNTLFSYVSYFLLNHSISLDKIEHIIVDVIQQNNFILDYLICPRILLSLELATNK